MENQYSTNHEESSFHDPTPTETSSSFALTYDIMESSSKRGRPELIDRQGYSYTLQRRWGLVNDWQCSIRPKVNPYRATVRQRGDQFQYGNHVHDYQAQVGALTAAKIPMRNRTSDLRILHSNALPLSHRDSTVSEVSYEVHMTRVLHTARISNVDSLMFVDGNKRDGEFLSSVKKGGGGGGYG